MFSFFYYFSGKVRLEGTFFCVFFVSKANLLDFYFIWIICEQINEMKYQAAAVNGTLRINYLSVKFTLCKYKILSL